MRLFEGFSNTVENWRYDKNFVICKEFQNWKQLFKICGICHKFVQSKMIKIKVWCKRTFEGLLLMLWFVRLVSTVISFSKACLEKRRVFLPRDPSNSCPTEYRLYVHWEHARARERSVAFFLGENLNSHAWATSPGRLGREKLQNYTLVQAQRTHEDF